MATLISDLTTFIETQLNDNANGVTIDLGYLFERDGDGAYVTKAINQQTLQIDATPYVPAMLQFKGDWNKPLNFDKSNQLAKSGSIIMWFSLPDRDLKPKTDQDKNTYENILLTLEEFENKFSGYRENSAPLQLTSNGKTYNVLINSSPLIDNGSIIKQKAGWRVLVTVSLSIKLGYNIAYAENVKTEIKRYGADDSTYVELELSDTQPSYGSAIDTSQADGDKFGYSGIQTTTTNLTFLFYYPYGTAYDVDTKSLLIEFYRRIADKTYTPSRKYTVRSTYPDFTVVNDYYYAAGTPMQKKGVELSASITFSPYKE